MILTLIHFVKIMSDLQQVLIGDCLKVINEKLLMKKVYCFIGRNEVYNCFMWVFDFPREARSTFLSRGVRCFAWTVEPPFSPCRRKWDGSRFA